MGGEPMKYAFICVVVFLFTLDRYIERELNKPYVAVKTGLAELYCHIGNDPQKLIDPTMVTGYLPEHGIWLFENGSAKQCEVRYK